MSYSIRPLVLTDEPFLWQMLYHAIHVPEGYPDPPPELVFLPELARYVNDWGRQGDLGFLAYETATNSFVGAVWLRLLTGEKRGYGYVDDATPELSMAVLPAYRSQGLGTQLLKTLFTSGWGNSPVSLSVSADNPARRLYKRFGFEVVGEEGPSLTMKRKANSSEQI